MRLHAYLFLHRPFPFLFALALLAADGALAQRGRWMEHALPAGSGGGLFQCGDRIAAYTPAQGSTCLFYDTQHGRWTEATLASPQGFDELLANGDVALARSESLLVAYSVRSGTWDTVHVRGSYLNPAALVSHNLAAAATAEMLYVFDSEEGRWHERAYTPPSGYAGYGLLRTADDYAMLELVHLDATSTHIVYSLPQHAFNEIDGVPSAIPMDGGFVAVNYDDTYATLLGYCAETNQFSLENLTVQPYAARSYACNSITGTSCGFVWTEAPTPETRLDHFYCYDTRIGAAWSHLTRSWDPQYEGFTTAMAGDRYIGFPYSVKLAEEQYAISYVIYSGYTGGYAALPERTLWTPNLTFMFGSRCLLAVDSLKVWAYDATIAEERTFMTHRAWQAYNVEHHRDYTLFILQDPQSGPTMGVYAYSSVAHSFADLDLPATWNSALAGGHSALLINPGYDPPVIVFYSGQVGSFAQATSSSGLYPAGQVKDYMATSFFGSEGYLFDAVSGTLVNFPGEFGRSKLGTRAFIHWDAARVAHGYNIASRQWATVQMEADGLMTEVEDWIGLVPSYHGPTSFGQYYAYNGLYDCWVPLTPEGGYAGQMVGSRIALVVRTTKLYAFDPELLTGITSTEGVPGAWRLEQNYPNPFNPTTVVSYQLPVSSDIRLVVYDLLGREVAVLANERKPAGTYQATFDATGLASGVYVYRLTAGQFVRSMKMTVVK